MAYQFILPKQIESVIYTSALYIAEADRSGNGV